MRYEAVGPAEAVLDLLAHADHLAAAAVVAIARGDDEELTALLDQRGRIVEEAIAAWHTMALTAPGADVLAKVVTTAQASVRIGHEARAHATRVRDEIAGELSLLDARQSASQEYQSGSVGSAINVVL